MALEELLLAGCLGMVLVGLALEMGGRVWRYCADAAEYAQMSQGAVVLRSAWREFVHKCPTRPIPDDSGGLVAGEWRASVGAQGLDLRRATDTKVLPLPRGMTARIEHEGQPGEQERWTLALNWTSRRRSDIDQRHGGTRIVACRGELAL
jgi:hypothetical protein